MIATCITLVVVLLMLIFLRKRIVLAIALIKEASRYHIDCHMLVSVFLYIVYFERGQYQRPVTNLFISWANGCTP